MTIVQAGNFALTDGNGAPVSLDTYRGDGKWTLVLIRPSGCDTCEQGERELGEWYTRQEAREVSALVVHLDTEAGDRSSAGQLDGAYDIAFSLDPEATSKGYQELAGTALTTAPTWMFFGPSGLFIDAVTGANLDSQTLDEMIAADFGNTVSRATSAIASEPEVTLLDGPAQENPVAATPYERDLEAVMKEVRYAGSAIISLAGLDYGISESYAFEDELEALLESGDLEGFRNELTTRKLMVTPNPIMGMQLTVHPFQPYDAGRTIGEAILEGDLDALKAGLSTKGTNLDRSLYIGDYSLGVTPLVMAVVKQSEPMVRALLDAGASPNAPSSGPSRKTPMDAANAFRNKSIVEALGEAGAD